MSTIWGCGTDCIDHQEVGYGQFEVMQWLTLLFVPIIPLRALIIRPHGNGEVGAMWDSFHFQILDRIPLRLPRVLRVYGWTVLLLVVGVGPLVLVYINFLKPSLGNKVPWYFMELGFATVVWPMVILGILDNRKHKIKHKIYDVEYIDEVEDQSSNKEC